jgi:hypothetical protein
VLWGRSTTQHGIVQSYESTTQQHAVQYDNGTVHRHNMMEELFHFDPMYAEQ